MAKIIAMDNGKAEGKVKCGEKELVITNRYSLGNADEYFNGTDTYNVTYNGENYILGRKGTKSDKLEGKASEFHKISTLACITRFIEPGIEEDIILMYGESVDSYYDEDNKNAIISLLEGKHKITVDGLEYKINITYVHVLPEGLGHILQDLKNNMGIQYVIDLGGTTMNFLSVKDGAPIRDESFSLAVGKNNMISKLKIALKRNHYGKISDSLATQYLEEGSTDLQINKIIKSVIKETFEEIDDEIAAYINTSIQKQLKHYPVTFIGGTSLLLKKDILSHFRNEEGNTATIREDASLCNVRGFYAYGKAKFGNREDY